MSSKAQLEGYGTVRVIDEEESNTNPPTDKNFQESWVEAHVISTTKLDDVENVNVSQEHQLRPVYRDKGFAVLFILHLICFITVGLIYGSCPTGATVNTDTDKSGTSAYDDDNKSYNTKLTTSIIISFILSNLITKISSAIIIPNFSTLAVTVSLYTSLFINTLCLSLFFMAFPNIFTFIIVVAGMVGNWWYISAVRIFIPFAASNLKLATMAVRLNFGVYFISFVFALIGIFWVMFWMYTATGVGIFDGEENASSSDSNSSNSSNNNRTDDYYYAGDVAIFGLKGFSLLLSLYWTINVLANTVQTTIAGVTATYCFDKHNAASCCSSAVITSLYRSCTYSFGSVCFGSLLTAIITTLRVMAQWARDNSRRSDQNGAALLYCILTCILSLLEDIIEYFNQWAYVFIGIWGLDYLESGKRVLELFTARGCTAIISNGLASYVLTNVIIVSSLVCGLFGYFFIGDAASFG